MALYTPSLKRRFAALLYETLLVAAVSFAVLIPVAVVDFFLRAYPAAATFLTAVALLGGWYAYFMGNWMKKRQTVAMKAWRIEVRAANTAIASRRQLNLRFIWACIFIVGLPAAAYLAARNHWQIPALKAFELALLWWILPWGFAWLHPQRQFLYDYLAGTCLVQLPRT